MEIISFEKGLSRRLPPSWIGSCSGWKVCAVNTVEKKQVNGWTITRSAAGCVSAKNLQTLRDNGTLAFTKIGNRTYYRPDDVERVVGNVEEKRKEARWKGKTI